MRWVGLREGDEWVPQERAGPVPLSGEMGVDEVLVGDGFVVALDSVGAFGAAVVWDSGVYKIRLLGQA
jgi:hypothetical protein